MLSARRRLIRDTAAPAPAPASMRYARNKINATSSKLWGNAYYTRPPIRARSPRVLQIRIPPPPRFRAWNHNIHELVSTFAFKLIQRDAGA
jgi:hypothetical protein